MAMTTEESFHAFVAGAIVLLGEAGETSEDVRRCDSHPALRPLAGDGSNRRIYRIDCGEKRAIAISNPLPADRDHPDENEAFVAVREHLERLGVRVADLLFADLENGFLLLEDLGDLRLYDLIRERGWKPPRAVPDPTVLYEEAVRILVRMQRPEGRSFRQDLVANPPYTEAFILEHEARYFHDELLCGLAGLDADFSQVEPECRRLARRAIGEERGVEPARPDGGGATDPVFMHRDYQSRNLMVVGDGLALLDFQGARFGPAEYDLAALLYDPYVAMPEEIRDRLIRLYLREGTKAGVAGLPEVPNEEWEQRLAANAANRLMQALGAFAKLGGKLQRPGFLEHIPEGLCILEQVLNRLGDCPVLIDHVRRLRSMKFPEPPA